MHYVKQLNGTYTEYKKQELIKDRSLKGSMSRRSSEEEQNLKEVDKRLNKTIKLIQMGLLK